MEVYQFYNKDRQRTKQCIQLLSNGSLILKKYALSICFSINHLFSKRQTKSRDMREANYAPSTLQMTCSMDIHVIISSNNLYIYDRLKMLTLI